MAKISSKFTPLIRDKEHPENGSVIGIAASSCCGLVFFDVTDEERVQFTTDYSEELKKLLRNEGYSPYLPDDSFAPYPKGRSIANTVEERARHLINMLNNPRVEAIIQVDGGMTALEVANMLDQYDKDWKKVEANIADAWIKKHPGQILPNDFFTPRLASKFYTDSTGQQHGLPQRGIPLIGFSDISCLHNILGQRGVVRSYYANPLCILDCPRATKATDTISELEPITVYQGLIPGNKLLIPKGTLPVYATLLDRIVLTAGLPFQFHLQEPSLLAIESTFSAEESGKFLQEAQAKGLLDNVKGIVIGQVWDDEKKLARSIDPNNLSPDSSLRTFINESGIPVLFTDEKDTFGHGRNSIITKPFANFAPATLTAAENGTVTLRIEGHAPQETLDRLYTHRINIPLLEHMGPKESKKISGTLEKRTGPDRDFPLTDAIIIDSLELGDIKGTNINTQGKVCIVCSDGRERSRDHYTYTHMGAACMSDNLKLKDAKAVIVVIPPEKPVTLCNALSGIIDPNVTWKQEGNSISSEQQKVRVPYVEKALNNIGLNGIVVEVKPSGENDQKVIVSLTLTDEQQQRIMKAERPFSERSSWLEIMDDFGERYLGNTPLYILEDEALSQTKGMYAGRVQIQNSVVSSEREKFHDQKEKSWAERTLSFSGRSWEI
ncbi:MAG: LD-carboxypeptidase [Alphaproteobacteria bacterium]|nr:LD-carboxypeptidase [Alphaproteobacteria bacterium]